jgi:hypothetical protein
MATSVYFNNQGASREQFLIEDLINEAIRNHGIDVYYIPRDSQSSLDEIYGDDPVKSFTQAIKIDMYLETTDDFEGNEEFFSKFGLEIAKGVKMSVARKTFERFVTSVAPDRNVPKEGDLIYLPIQQKLMELKFVEQEKNFFQLGRTGTRGAGSRVGIETSKNAYMYGLSLELFKYNGELINTGYAEIDGIGDFRAFAINYTLSAGGSGTFLNGETVYQGGSLSTASATGYVVDFDVNSRILKVKNIKGEFASGTAIVGPSGTWTISSSNDMNNVNDPQQDNVRIENEAINVLDWTEHNPFGEV